MRSRFQYLRPKTLDEATDFLSHHGSESRILAGGTDLLIAVRNGVLGARYLVDVSRLDELRRVSIHQGRLIIGSALTYSEIINNSLIREFAPALLKACGQVGSLQIRNSGTLGGNVGNASPAADSVPVMMVHDAQALIKGPNSEYAESLGSLIVGPYKINLKPGFLITGFSLEIWQPGFRWAYNRIARRRALSISRAGAAAMAIVNTNGIIEQFRLSLSSISPQPSLMHVAEEYLLGQVPTAKLIWEAGQTVAEEMVRRSGERPSFLYKKPAVTGLTIKTLEEVFLDHEQF